MRERTWNVLSKRIAEIEDASIVMIYKENTEPSGIGVLYLGEPPRRIIDADGVALSYLG